MNRNDNNNSVHINDSCPFAEKQNPGCFCVNLNSQKIRLTTQYCLADYLDCPHYPAMKALYAPTPQATDDAEKR